MRIVICVHQDHLFRRRLRVSQLDALRAWTDPDILSLWFWPGADDTVHLLPAQRGDSYSITSRSRGVSFSGVCLDLDLHGFDLTWHIDGLGFHHEGFDTLSVRLFERAEGGIDLALSYTVNSAISGRVSQLWVPPLDRLSALDPRTLSLAGFGSWVA